MSDETRVAKLLRQWRLATEGMTVPMSVATLAGMALAECLQMERELEAAVQP